MRYAKTCACVSFTFWDKKEKTKPFALDQKCANERVSDLPKEDTDGRLVSSRPVILLQSGKNYTRAQPQTPQ
ncbi:unnamed protein product [Laminaria digitata]